MPRILPGNAKKLKGKLSISHCHGHESFVRIELMDEISGTSAVQIEISFEEFGKAIGSLASRPCEFEYGRSDYVGKKTIEHKTEKIMVPKELWYDVRDPKIGKKLLKPYEVDGWEGSLSDLCNHHRWCGHAPDGGHYVSVGFERFVDVEAPKKARKGEKE